MEPVQNMALEFDGKSGHVEIPSLLNDKKQLWTVEMTVVPQGRAAGQLLFSSKGEELHVALSRSQENWFNLGWSHSRGRQAIRVNNNSIEPGKTYHLAVVQHGFSGRAVSLFVNGKRISRTGPALPVTMSHFQISRSDKCWLGTIDDVRVSNIARYNDDFNPPQRYVADEHTLALYHFDEGQGNKVFDVSGNGHHGTIVGNVKWVKAESVPLEETQATPPPRNLQLQLDGETGYVEFPTLKHDGKFPLTIEMTVERGEGKRAAHMLVFSNAVQKKQYQRPWQGLVVEMNGYDMLGAAQYGDGKYPWLSANSQVRSPAGRRHQLAAVYEENSVAFYLDGKHLRTNTGEEFNFQPSQLPFVLGCSADQKNHFIGRIDELRISYTARYTGDYQPLERLKGDEHTLALYHFDEGQGSKVLDASGNEHHGTIVGDVKWVRTMGEPFGDTRDVIPDGPVGEVLVIQHERLCFDALFTPDGRRIIYIGGGGVHFADLQPDGPPVVRRLNPDAKSGRGLALIPPDGKRFLATAYAENGTIVEMLDTGTGERLATMEGHIGDNVKHLAVAPDGEWAVSAATLSTRLWDLKTKRHVGSLATSNGDVGAAAISPDGRWVFGSSLPRLWRTDTWEPDRDHQKLLVKLRNSIGHHVGAAAFSPDGRHIAMSIVNHEISQQPCVVVWDLEERREQCRFSGHGEGAVMDLAWASDGQRIISCGGDCSVRLWEPMTGKQLRAFQGHMRNIHGVSFSFDERLAVTASEDKTVRVWRLPRPTPSDAATAP